MKSIQGIVVALATPQTARVKVEREWQHPLYKKFVKRSKHYACHVVDLELAVGDQVSIQECRPISKTKRFKVVAKISTKSALKAKTKVKPVAKEKTA